MTQLKALAVTPHLSLLGTFGNVRNKENRGGVISTRFEAMLTGRTRVLAVFGCPVEHSLSPAMHNAAIEELGLDLIYVPFRVEPEKLAAAVEGVRAMKFAGVNLTIPLKEAAVGLVDDLSPESTRIGAVNTLWWKDGRLMGHSTDGEGFLNSLVSVVGRVPESALVLGAGGSARGVCFALAGRGAKVTIANRGVEKAIKLAGEIGGSRAAGIGLEPEALGQAASRSELIVNCTSVGMTPNDRESPLPAEYILPGHTVYDLVYSPLETALLKDATERGAVCIDGLKMLAHQGALSFELWTGVYPPVDVMEQACREAISTRSRTNIGG